MNYNLSVVLVRSIYASNVGAVSRAMSNMGAQRLILIDPRCEINLAAHKAAASGQAGLEQRTTYANWDEFMAREPAGIRLALSARDGRGRDARDIKITLDQIQPQSEGENLYLVLGPEDWGLAAEDLRFCHFCCTIPTFGENSSLNLAQAALLALFIVRSQWGGERTKLDGQTVSSLDSKAHGEISNFPEELIKGWIETLGFDLSKKKINAFTLIRRVLMRAIPTEHENRILETILHQTIRKLKENGHQKRSEAEIQ